MRCFRPAAETAARPDSTITDQANDVRPTPSASGDTSRPRLLSELLETRKVALMVRAPGEHSGPVHAAEVLCDLPGGRALVQILGSSVCFWAAQSSVARFVVAEVRA